MDRGGKKIKRRLQQIISLLTHPTAQKTVILSSAQVMSAGIGLASNFVLAYFLSVRQFGEYSLTLSIFNLLLMLLNLGFFTSVLRESARKSGSFEMAEFRGGTLILGTVIGLMGTLIILIGGLYIQHIWGNPALGRIFLLLSPLFIVLYLSSLFQQVFIGEGNIARLAKFVISQKSVFLIALLFPIIMDLKSVLMILSLNFLSFGIIFLFLGKITFHRIRTQIRELWRENVSFGLKLYLPGTLDQLAFNIDKIMLAIFWSSIEVGYYSIVTLLCSLILFIPQNLSRVLSKKFYIKKNISKRILSTNSNMLLIFNIAFIALTMPLLLILFNGKYAPAVDIIPIISTAYAIQGVYYPIHHARIIQGQKALIKHSYMSSLINFALNLILIPPFGIVGAAVATLACRSYWGIILSVFYVE